MKPQAIFTRQRQRSFNYYSQKWKLDEHFTNTERITQQPLAREKRHLFNIDSVCGTHPLQVLTKVSEEFQSSVQDVLLLLGQVVHLVPL